MSVRYELHHYFHMVDAEALTILHRIEAKMSQLSDKVDTVIQKVTDETTIEQSAITLLNGLTAIIADLKTQLAAQADPATLQKLDDLANTIETRKAALAAAITANTPA